MNRGSHHSVGNPGIKYADGLPEEVRNVDDHSPVSFPFDIEKVSELLTSLANEHLLRIAVLLLDLERSVTELSILIGISLSLTSRCLSHFRRAEVVNTREAAQTVFYSMNSTPFTRIIQDLHLLGILPKLSHG